jgi:hypothetical protein
VILDAKTILMFLGTVCFLIKFINKPLGTVDWFAGGFMFFGASLLTAIF